MSTRSGARGTILPAVASRAFRARLRTMGERMSQLGSLPVLLVDYRLDLVREYGSDRGGSVRAGSGDALGPEALRLTPCEPVPVVWGECT